MKLRSRTSLPLAFQKYNNTWAIRNEGFSLFQCLINGIQVEDTDNAGYVTSNSYNSRTKNGPLKDELVRQIVRHRFIEAERDRLWKFKAPTLQKSVVKSM